MKRKNNIVVAICLCLLLASCGGNSTTSVTQSPPPPPSPVISISPQTANLQHSFSDSPSQVQFSVTVQNVSNPRVIWLVNGAVSGQASMGSITETGLYTAPQIGPAEPVTITAYLEADSRYSADAVVQLSCAERIRLSTPEGTVVSVNGRLPIVAAAESSCHPYDSRTLWTVDGVLTGTPITGMITPGTQPGEVWFFPPSTPPLAPVTVTAALKESPQTSASLMVNVTPSTEDTLTISPSAVSLGLSAQQQFKVFYGSQETTATWLVNGKAEPDARTGWIWEGLYKSPLTEPTTKQIVVTAVDTSSTSNRFASSLVTVTAPAGNNNSRLRGTYVVFLHSYFELLGKITFDGNGGLTGSAEVFGQWADQRQRKGAITGTYELDWDGHAVIQAKVPYPFSDAQSQQTWEVMFASEGYGEVLANEVGMGSGAGFIERQDVEGFNGEAFAATYVAALTQNIPCPPYVLCDSLPILSLGAIRADAAGQLSGQIDGYEGPSEVRGTYDVGSDGVGTATFRLPDGTSALEFSFLAVSRDKFVLAGLSGLGTISGVADRRAPGISASTLKGPYVFKVGAMLARFEADGIGQLSGVFDDYRIPALYEPFSVRRDIPFSSTFSVDQWGRVPLSWNDPEMGEQNAVLYLAGPDRFSMLGPLRSTWLETDSYREPGVGYAQKLPPDLNGILGRYASRDSGWAIFESSGQAIGVQGPERSAYGFTFQLPTPDGKGKGEILSGFSLIPTFYVVSPDKLLMVDSEFNRMDW